MILYGCSWLSISVVNKFLHAIFAISQIITFLCGKKTHVCSIIIFFFVDARIVNSDFVKHTVAHTHTHTHTQIGLCKMPIYFLMIGTHGPDSFYLIHNQPYYVGIIC